MGFLLQQLKELTTEQVLKVDLAVITCGVARAVWDGGWSQATPGWRRGAVWGGEGASAPRLQLCMAVWQRSLRRTESASPRARAGSGPGVVGGSNPCASLPRP